MHLKRGNGAVLTFIRLGLMNQDRPTRSQGTERRIDRRPEYFDMSTHKHMLDTITWDSGLMAE